MSGHSLCNILESLSTSSAIRSRKYFIILSVPPLIISCLTNDNLFPSIFILCSCDSKPRFLGNLEICKNKRLFKVLTIFNKKNEQNEFKRKMTNYKHITKLTIRYASYRLYNLPRQITNGRYSRSNGDTNRNYIELGNTNLFKLLLVRSSLFSLCSNDMFSGNNSILLSLIFKTFKFCI